MGSKIWGGDLVKRVGPIQNHRLCADIVDRKLKLNKTLPLDNLTCNEERNTKITFQLFQLEKGKWRF